MRVSDTSAIPIGLRSRVPAKMTSSMRAPRSDLADCSPRTQVMASEMFDFPHPFGPIIPATPSPWNFSSVRSQNDLNPRICSFFSFSNLRLLRAAVRPGDAVCLIPVCLMVPHICPLLADVGSPTTYSIRPTKSSHHGCMGQADKHHILGLIC